MTWAVKGVRINQKIAEIFLQSDFSLKYKRLIFFGWICNLIVNFFIILGLIKQIRLYFSYKLVFRRLIFLLLLLLLKLLRNEIIFIKNYLSKRKNPLFLVFTIFTT